jgi:dienelactone hydrolase
MNWPRTRTIAERDEIIQQADALRHSVDYLESRDDIDHDKLGFFAINWGGGLFPILTALEPRFKAIAIWSGGCDAYKVLPEADPMNFAPRVKAPVLMINGRYDFQFPLETCQEPMFRALGTPPADKKTHSVRHRAHACRLANYERHPRLVRSLSRPREIEPRESAFPLLLYPRRYVGFPGPPSRSFDRFGTRRKSLNRWF